MSQEQFLFEFGNPLAGRGWHTVDDVVMGGVSKSRFNHEPSVGVFEGEVSLEQNGGFASVRSGVLEGVTGEGLVIRVRGDGKFYALRLRLDDEMDGVSFEWKFVTRDRWDEFRVPWTAFTPVFRGRRVWFAPKLEAHKVRSVGFIITKQPGPFRLEVDWIKMYQ